MKIKILTSLIFVLFVFNVFSQDSNIKNRWNIKLASQINPSDKKKYLNYNTFYHFNANYGISNHIEGGLNIAYSGGTLTAKGLKYFSNFNLQILPFFIDAEDFRFDLYATATCGGITYFNEAHELSLPDGTNKHIPPSKLSKFYYGAGIGLVFYPFKRIGIFTEYSFQAYFQTKAMFFKYGTSVKF